jgi:imidazolonepropionase-like amidohydrolase
LELLVDAGLTPLEAITAGTYHNAKFLGIEYRLGALEPGKTADLILIEGDPTRDIEVMRHVRRVMLNGVWVHEAR